MDYCHLWESYLTPEIKGLINEIKDYQQRYINDLIKFENQLDTMNRIAIFDSCIACSQLENLKIGNQRIRNLVLNSGIAKTTNENELIGYCNSINFVYRNFPFMLFEPEYIHQLHDNCYRFLQLNPAGKFRKLVFDPNDGDSITCLSTICRNYQTALNNDVEPLMLIPLVICEFVRLQPYSYGNLRVARLLMLSLLLKHEFSICKYVSFDALLLRYMQGHLPEFKQWFNDSNCDYHKFIVTFLKVLLNCYLEFNKDIMFNSLDQKDARCSVIETLKNNNGSMSKADIDKNCIMISPLTIRHILQELVREGIVIKIGNGRYTLYQYNYSNNKL